MKKLNFRSTALWVPYFIMLFSVFNVQAQIPSDLMRNCNQWKITYPTGDEEKQLCNEDNNEFFYVNDAEDGIVFRAPVRKDNGTTPRSSYIRSELREREEDGSKDIYWTTEGRHVLYVEQAITHLPIVKSHLVATQIHGDKAAGIDDALVLRLEEKHLFLSFNGNKLRSDVTVTTNYQLGKKHEIMFEVLDDKHYVYYSEDGNLWNAYTSGNASQYLVKDNGDPVLMDLNYDQSYFKVGNYTQSNPEEEGDETDNPNNYGEVVVYDFIVEHGGEGYGSGNNGGGDGGSSNLAPYDLAKFQDYLNQSKLQAPGSNTAATTADIINKFKSENFYVAETDKMGFTMSGTSQRSELRNENNWYVNDGNQTLHANLKIEDQTCDQLTVLQIHDDANEGVGNGPNKPLLRIYRHTTKSPTDHIWAVIKTDVSGANDEHIDLGATPSGYFDCDLTIENGNLIISVNGAQKASRNISYWNFPSYWKNGVYLQDEGTATVYFNELTLTTSSGSGVDVSSVSLSPSTISLNTGETEQLTATVSPSNADNKNVTYSSSNSSVVTVNSNGLVTAISQGTATITVTTEDGNRKATSNVTVSSGSTSSLIPADLMRNCNQWKITYPTGEEEKQLCDEDNNEFFYVNGAEDGIVFRSPVRSDNGTTPNSSYIRSELRERTEDGSKDIYWTTEGRHVLYVEQAITHLPIVKSHLVATQIHGDKEAGIDDALVLRLEDEHLFLSFNGNKLRSDVTVKTDYQLGTKHEVIFEVVDDKHYVYYSEEGNLWEAYTSGNATQYLVKDNGNPVLMDLNYDQSYFKVGNYTQSNPDEEGDETDNPNNYGEVVVYDFIVEHGESEPAAVSGVELSPNTITLALNGTQQLTASVLPNNAGNKGVSFTSSNSSVATVDANGLVSAVSEGTTIITVTTNEGNYTATAEITVKDIPQGLENIALNKPVATTGIPDEGAEVDNLVDGDTDTRVSVSGYPQTFTIDLGANYDMSYSEIVFYEERAYQYTISTSTLEEGPYTEVVDRTANTTAGTAANPLTDYFTATGRYVQITVTGADNYTGDWISIMEFRVFGEETLITSVVENFENNFAVYPIPAGDVLHYEFQNTQGAELIQVYDLTGNMLYSETISENKGILEIGNLPKGMYLLKIEGQTTYIKRFTKQ